MKGLALYLKTSLSYAGAIRKAGRGIADFVVLPLKRQMRVVSDESDPIAHKSNKAHVERLNGMRSSDPVVALAALKSFVT